MNDPLPNTKFLVPRQPRTVVKRAALLGRLDDGLTGRVTLVSAPPGFGKSTLIADWLEDRDHTHAWLSLDEGDSDPQRFMHCLMSALRVELPGLGESVSGALASPQPPEPHAVLTVLLNELAAIPTTIVLVLDDYHRIQSAAVDRALVFLIEHIPPRLHLVMLTREDPALPLAQWRAKGWLNELRQTGLRFSSEEATSFLNHSMRLDLPGPVATALTERTEGWVAGLQMAAVSLRGERTPEQWLDDFSGRHRFIMDYLIEEVLNAQSVELQRFLLCTAFLTRLNGPLCDAVLATEPGTSQAWLEYMERANLFLIPLDQQRQWYRYHHLFSDLLRQQGTLRFQEDAMAARARAIRASEWFESRDDRLEAFRYAAMAQDIPRARRLAEGRESPLYMQGNAGPVLDWLRTLPTQTLDSSPVLWVLYATVLSVTGRNSELDPVLVRAEAAVGRHDIRDEQTDLTGRLAALHAMRAAPRYEADSVLAHSETALARLADTSVAMRSQATWSLGFAHQLMGRVEPAAACFQSALTLSEQCGNDFVRNLAGTGLGYCREAELQLYPAERLYRSLAEVPPARRLPSACEACFGLSRVLYQWNQLTEADEWLDEGIRLAGFIEQIDSVWTMKAFRIRLALARGHHDQAAEQLRALSEAVRRQGYPVDWQPLREAEAWLALSQGDMPRATTVTDPNAAALWSARRDLANQDWDGALRCLNSLADDENGSDTLQSAQVGLLTSLVWQGMGYTEDARGQLIDCLARTEPGSLIRLYLDEGRDVQAALLDLKQAGHSSSYLNALLDAFGGSGTDETHSGRPSALIEPLTRRELAVLTLMADGLSNQEIGDRLFLALSTVKGYNRALFDKLQVRRRTEAVARARELGVL
ncbi:LuxR C-terminal-related transcriptional regulator [Saccharospirillum salsuginis]|uniref:Helix-turn-helix transcriptional regulator n=1 Tax=Saccharospirillum salsuginis TaxID=418750 RepID=A0A918KR15_9GAMM|nr:LuxR C-terminal-related transcriptional regulator [Saccharospirillum salsuginis]GGX73526.1 helix-turn-helix transcriptional regulator [Saccharospirillum salsuginis]